MEEKLKNPVVQTVDNPETAAERDRALAAIAEKDAEIVRLNKQLMVAGDAALTKFKVKFADLQNILSDIVTLLDEMEEPNKSKCRGAVQSVVEGCGL